MPVELEATAFLTIYTHVHGYDSLAIIAILLLGMGSARQALPLVLQWARYRYWWYMMAAAVAATEKPVGGRGADA
jgi:hypothetical protein